MRLTLPLRLHFSMSNRIQLPAIPDVEHSP
ncbi:hypothetical protein SAMN05421783_1503 [Thiocapsa roseopersicina]|uniref:Uncharacterized protein n=1 Tax=Thiocapsa roseopersicina TaxID=1058 RepID=A0A1H3DK12_THIRO|nr:hypothetical protein THIOKS1260004 [Thiocapsa sp. KS1]SDX65989.1 hypothetical protein SAMN05421783_1503 [Thiocapsa roseopersicina]